MRFEVPRFLHISVYLDHWLGNLKVYSYVCHIFMHMHSLRRKFPNFIQKITQLVCLCWSRAYAYRVRNINRLSMRWTQLCVCRTCAYLTNSWISGQQKNLKCCHPQAQWPFRLFLVWTRCLFPVTESLQFNITKVVVSLQARLLLYKTNNASIFQLYDLVNLPMENMSMS